MVILFPKPQAFSQNNLETNLNWQMECRVKILIRPSRIQRIFSRRVWGSSSRSNTARPCCRTHSPAWCRTRSTRSNSGETLSRQQSAWCLRNNIRWKCPFRKSVLVTVHLNSEDAFVTCRPHRTLNTRLAQQQAFQWLIWIYTLCYPYCIKPPVYAYFLELTSTPQTSHLKQEKWKHFPPLSVISW